MGDTGGVLKMCDDGAAIVGIIMVIALVFLLGYLIGNIWCGHANNNQYAFTCYDDAGKMLWTEKNIERSDYYVDGDYAYTGNEDDKHVCRTHWTVEKECNEKEDRCR
jgi:hypothetical protein